MRPYYKFKVTDKPIRILAGVLLLGLIFSMLAFNWKDAWTEKQQTAHEIAEMARELGLEETDPIIVRAQELWWEDYEASLANGEAMQAQEQPDILEPFDDAQDNVVAETEEPVEQPVWYTQQDIDIIASVVYNEAGYDTTDRHKELVAAVVVNRVLDPRFPSSVYGVVTQPYQYYVPYAQYGSYYMNRAMQSDIWQGCCDIAVRALNGEIECPPNVLFQANFTQGNGVYEYGYTSYSTTYFCYG